MTLKITIRRCTALTAGVRAAALPAACSSTGGKQAEQPGAGTGAGTASRPATTVAVILIRAAIDKKVGIAVTDPTTGAAGAELDHELRGADPGKVAQPAPDSGGEPSRGSEAP